MASGKAGDDGAPLHMLKLCVGAERVEDLIAWQTRRRKGGAELRHVTRMWPRRADEIAGRGSLYWVFKGYILARQPIARFEPVEGDDGIRRCGIVLDPEVARTVPTPRRAFQGWRYLEAKDAPADLGEGGAALAEMPEEMRRALAELGVR